MYNIFHAQDVQMHHVVLLHPCAGMANDVITTRSIVTFASFRLALMGSRVADIVVCISARAALARLYLSASLGANWLARLRQAAIPFHTMRHWRPAF